MILCQTGVHCYFTGFITIFEKLNATFEPLTRTKSRVYYFNYPIKKLIVMALQG
ncbi:hypothetical protein SAMN02910263_04473 [Butyrivibrio sp. INlla16]|nr:hypothetical protein SAMN02910263_04473 [Butyrivibrio sp. INlla16]